MSKQFSFSAQSFRAGAGRKEQRGARGRRKGWSAAVGLLATALILASCAGGDSSDDEGSKTITFRLDYSPWGAEAPFFVAQEKGYYKDAGLDVKLLPGKGSGASTQSVFAGHDDMGHVFMQAATLAIDKGAKGKAVGMLSNGSGNGIFVEEGGGIDTLKDLYGKTLATAPSTGSEYILEAVFDLNNLDLSKVDIKRTEVGTLNAIYGQRKVDAMMQEIAYANPMVQAIRPSKHLRFKDFGFPLVHYGIIANQKMLDNRPDDVKAFLEATAKGYQDAVDDPEGAARAVEKHADQLTYEQILDQWEQSMKIRSGPGTEGLAPLCSTDEAWEAMLDLLNKYAGLESDPSVVDKFYTQEFLDCD